MDFLASTQNPRVKELVRMQEKAAVRNEEQLFVVEGFREIQRALITGYRASSIFYFENLDPGGGKIQKLQELQPGIPVTGISSAVFAKLAYREGSDGLIGVMHMKSHQLESLQLPENPLIVVLESVEKPGNLGAVLRTCDGAGVDAVIICDPKTDIYNPNCVRSSVGCLFSVPVGLASTETVLRFFREKGIRSFAAALTADEYYYGCDFRSGTAFILGTEADGLTENWLKGANQQIKIPMKGIADSLNVSIAAAILVYEALRQRK